MIDEELVNALSQIIGSVVTDWVKMEPQRRANFEIAGEILPKAIARTIILQNMLDINPKKAILVVMDQGIGNMVMLTPTLRALRELYPKTIIDILCKAPSDQVIRGWDVINNVKTDLDENDVGKYDITLFSFWSQDYRKLYGQLFQRISKRFYDINIFDDFDIHEAQYDLDLAHICGYKERLPKQFCMTDDSILDTYNLRDKSNLVAISDTTLNLPEWQIKRYPHYVSLSKKLIDQGYQVVLIGGKAEEENLKNQHWPEGVMTSLLGRTTIPQSASVMKQCLFAICNDSAGAHIAAAVGTKTFVLFGPTKVSKNRPLGDHVYPIVLDKSCAPCQYTKRFGLCQPKDCLGNIKPEEILERIKIYDEANKKILLVGVFAGEDILKTEIIAEKYLIKKGYQIERFPYREIAANVGPGAMTAKLVKRIVETDPALIFICGGQQIVPKILAKYKNIVKSKLLVWYQDQRGGVEPWLVELGRQAEAIFWSTGDRRMLFELSSLSRTPVYFMPATSDSLDIKITKEDKKKFSHDVVFVGGYYENTPRVELINILMQAGVNVKIFGPKGWPEKYNYQGGPIYGEDLYKLFKLSKVVISTNAFNNIRYCFSRRLFTIGAAGGFNITQYVPGMEDIFEDKKHLVWFKEPQEAVKLVKYYLASERDREREKIAQEGQRLFLDKFTYDKILDKMLELTLEKGRYQNIFVNKGKLPKISLIMPVSGYKADIWYHETELEIEKYFEINYNVAAVDDEFCLTINVDATIRNFKGVNDIGLPVIPMVHDVPTWRLKGEHYSPQLKQFIDIVREAPCALGLSKNTCEEVKKHCQQNKIIPWYIGLAITVEDENKYDIKAQDQVIFISRFVERKYPLDILKALKLLKEKTGKTLMAVFVTSGGDQKIINECTAFCKQNMIPFDFKQIHLDDLGSKIKEIKKSLCLISSSGFEGFGISPGESLYCRRPCIITNIPSHVEAYGDKAIYFEPRNIDQLTEKLEMLIKDEGMQKKLGDEGHDYIVNNFTPKHSALAFKEKVYPFIRGNL